jgi:hypothetical protein
MTALTAGRNTPMSAGDLREKGMAAAVTLYAGAITMRNAAGFLTKGATATGLVGVGRAEGFFDNSTGAAGDIMARYRPGTFRFANSASTDEITDADAGKLCFVVDDQTVAKTDGTGTRSAAGTVAWVDELGVWVTFDEAITRAAVVAAAAYALASA